MKYYSILNGREGNKKRYLDYLLPLFPNHNLYIEPFFGTGSVFINKEPAKYSIINDHDTFVYQLFKCIEEDSDKLKETFENTLIYFDFLKDNLGNDSDSYKYVACGLIRFMYSLYGSTNAILNNKCNAKKLWLNSYDKTIELIKERLKFTLINNKDVFKFINSIRKTQDAFVYCDPPYSVSKGGLDANKGWDLERLNELIVLLKKRDWAFMISEYNDEQVIKLFKQHDLNILHLNKSVGINATYGNVKNEIAAVNYSVNDKLF